MPDNEWVAQDVYDYVAHLFTGGRRRPARRSARRADSVFVVHGRDDRARLELSAFLRSLHVKVIDWNTALTLARKGSPPIQDVIRAAFRYAQAIVVLMTPDDEARLRGELHQDNDERFEKELRGQPRQNVLFEAGMAFGKSEHRTILVKVRDIRPMTDIAGIHSVQLKDPNSRTELIAKLKAARVKFDDSGNDWRTTGDFDNL